MNGDPYGRRQAQREQTYGYIDEYVAGEEERKGLEQSLEDRKRAMFAWVARRRAAAAERKQREETATIRDAGEEAKSRVRSNSAYGGRKSVGRRRRGKKTVKRTRRR
jgi:hypothetical protein